MDSSEAVSALHHFLTCSVCFANFGNVVLLPCRHRTCFNCYFLVNPCPVCRGPINGFTSFNLQPHLILKKAEKESEINESEIKELEKIKDDLIKKIEESKQDSVDKIEKENQVNKRQYLNKLKNDIDERKITLAEIKKILEELDEEERESERIKKEAEEAKKNNSGDNSRAKDEAGAEAGGEGEAPGELEESDESGDYAVVVQAKN